VRVVWINGLILVIALSIIVQNPMEKTLVNPIPIEP